MMSLVTIRTFDNPLEAHLFRTVLENEGVSCEVFDEIMVGLNPLNNITLGGVKLKVTEDQLEQALSILQKVEESPYKDESDETRCCPNCGSEKLYSGFKSLKGTKGFFSAIFIILLMVYPPYVRSRFRCKECGKEFKG